MLWHDILMRWLILVMVALFVTRGHADAQAFKPRGGAKTPAKTPAKKATTAKKATAPKKAPKAKKSSRAAQSSARPDDLTPDDSPSKKSKETSAEDEDDYVLIEDD